MPVISAIVPPDTPGTISAAPIATPLKKRPILCFNLSLCRFWRKNSIENW